ncbi:KPN_02809 family neutral zinc metallopeptidase [Streptococcus plurextorum]|uniref:KPN_02809 family neutral zinc metallopeptidase n=1 Tax=Streptococcus plurextorum TaxID=456876 RepID=UPI0003FE9DDA|nr:neutral zinc metallopeptidase [Streptococcus plurextorum]
MKIDDLRKSQNVEDKRGQTSGRNLGSSFNRGNSNNQLLLQLLFSRTGWKTKLILILLLVFLGGGTGISELFSGNSNSYSTSQVTQTANTSVSDKDAEFISKVLASTEDFWTKEFQRNGLNYQPPKLVLYTDYIETASGTGYAQSGPFYSPADQKIYLDLSFYQDLSTKYGASGDFAMAYVIAHEVGHHVQNELGTLSDYAKKHSRLSEVEGNKLNVRLELQADYYAGAWANAVADQGLLDIGDIDEALTAAHAVGDDHLQQEAYGRTMPDSFTHGTSEQRKRWFQKGYDYGDLQHGDTFSIPENQL